MINSQKKYLFIGGAPKCGTSALFYTLAKTGHVIKSEPKETFFFIDRNYPLLNTTKNVHISPIEEYHSYFDLNQPGDKILMEGTTHLLYQKDIIETIARLDKKKVLFILRDPVLRIQSSFYYTKHNLGRAAADLNFETYAESILSDKAYLLEDKIDAKSFPILINELNNSDYLSHLKLWRSVFGSDDILILTYENLRQNSRSTIQQIFYWLGLDGLPAETLENANITSGRNFPRIHQLLKDLGGGRMFGGTYLHRIYMKMQSRKIIKDQTSDQRALKMLNEYFLEKVEDLEAYLGVQLPWLEEGKIIHGQSDGKRGEG